MTLDKAIEIKERTGEEFLATDPDEIEEADRLSFEALKAIPHYRRIVYPDQRLPLLGETKD